MNNRIAPSGQSRDSDDLVQWIATQGLPDVKSLTLLLEVMSTVSLLAFRARCVEVLHGTAKLVIVIEAIDRLLAQREVS